MNSKIIKKRKKRVINAFHHAWSFWPLLLAHHPQCANFNGHTLNFGRVRLCIGCFVGYPTAYISIFIIYYLNLLNIIPYQSFLVIGLILLSTFFLSFTNLTKIKIIKVIQKIFIGIGAAFLFWWIWSRDAPISVRYYTFSLIFGLIVGILNLYHAYGFFIKCYKCNTPFAWGSCAGFKFIRDYQAKYNLRNIFEEMDNYSKRLIQKREEKKRLKS